MGFLQKLFGKREPAVPVAVVCPHTTLVPRWDSPAAMGDESKATGFRCDTCGASFTAAEGQALRATEAQRVQEELKLPPD
jgi:hypothetical protein